MPNESHPIILHQHPTKLQVSRELKAFMLAWDFANLHVMLSRYSAAQLLNREGFSYHCLVDLYGFLEENGCEELLRE